MESNKFWSEMKTFNYRDIKQADMTSDQQVFVQALNALDKANDCLATERFASLYSSSEDSEMRDNASKLLFQNLYWNDKWDEIMKLELHNNEAIDLSYRQMAVILGSVANRAYTFTKKNYMDDLKLSISGSPIMNVCVNGINRSFWLDTGALMSVLSSETVELCNIKIDEKDEIEVQSSTSGKVMTKYTFVENFEVGNFKINSTPFLVLPIEALTIVHPVTEEVIKIDGIVGWDLIRYMNLKLDYKNGKYEISEPVHDGSLARNMLVDSYLVVKGSDKEGSPLYFGSDTGANKTSFDDSILSKIKHGHIRTQKHQVGGVTGFVEVEAKVLPELEFKINDIEFKLNDLKNATHSACSFFKVDGILGSDISRDACLTLDYLNRHFNITK